MTHFDASGESAPHERHVSRRTVAKAAVWSVPVLAVAVATPLAAASVTTLDISVFGFCTTGVGYQGRGFAVTVTGTLPIGSEFTLTGPVGSTVNSGSVELSPSIYSFTANGTNSVIMTTLGVWSNSTLTFWLTDTALPTNSLAGFSLSFNGSDATPLNNAASVSAGLDTSGPPRTICF